MKIIRATWWAKILDIKTMLLNTDYYTRLFEKLFNLAKLYKNNDY